MIRQAIYKGHRIELHIGSRQINRQKWWYKVDISGKEKRYIFPAWNSTLSLEALDRAKMVIDALPTEPFKCWNCWKYENGYGINPPHGWGLELDKAGMAQDICGECLVGNEFALPNHF